jgi:hypothetical protein
MTKTKLDRKSEQTRHFSRKKIEMVISFSGMKTLSEERIDCSKFDDFKKVIESEHIGQGTLVEVIYKIGYFRDPRAVVPLYHRLSDKHADVRRAAATSLGRLRQSSRIARVKLLDMFNDKKEEMSVRAAVAGALGEIGDKNALKPLIRSMSSRRDENMHSVIAYALGNLRDRGALPCLRRALKKYEADEGNPTRHFLLRAIEGAIEKIEKAQ